MCTPPLIIAGAGLAIEAGSKIVAAKGQDKQAKAVAANAEQAKVDTWKSLSLQEGQQADATAQTIMQADRQARTADAMARVAAGEAGVSGASVDALLGDIGKRALEFKATQERNLKMTTAQIQQEKKSAIATAQNRINAAPPPNPFATGLSIAGSGAELLSRKLPLTPNKG